jgi:hypothetical protein
VRDGRPAAAAAAVAAGTTRRATTGRQANMIARPLEKLRSARGAINTLLQTAPSACRVFQHIIDSN